MLQTKNLGYWYQDQKDYLYKAVNLTFEKGKMYAILGESGSGKTTFLSVLSGLDLPKEGMVLYNGQSIQKIGLRNFRKNDASIIFQAYNLLPYLSALDNVLTAMSISKTKAGSRVTNALEKLASVGIDQKLAKKPVLQLSGGQQQRVAIARAICCHHQVIVADEPTGNLDEQTSEEIIQLFQKVAHQENKCIIIVTHEKQIAQVCDVVYELKKRAFHLVEK